MNATSCAPSVADSSRTVPVPSPNLVKLIDLATRVSRLSTSTGPVRAGILASLVQDAHRALGHPDGEPAPAPAPAPTFEQLPLASSTLSIEERAKWINVLDPLLKYAGRPGDWGRESKLGVLTMRLMQARAEIVATEGRES